MEILLVVILGVFWSWGCYALGRWRARSQTEPVTFTLDIWGEVLHKEPLKLAYALGNRAVRGSEMSSSAYFWLCRCEEEMKKAMQKDNDLNLDEVVEKQWSDFEKQWSDLEKFCSDFDKQCSS